MNRIQFDCPDCHSPIDVAATSAGRYGRCLSCGVRLRVPPINPRQSDGHEQKRRWHILQFGEVVGPYSDDDISIMIERGEILPDSLLRSQSGDWQTIAHVESILSPSRQSSPSAQHRHNFLIVERTRSGRVIRLLGAIGGLLIFLVGIGMAFATLEVAHSYGFVLSSGVVSLGLGAVFAAMLNSKKMYWISAVGIVAVAVGFVMPAVDYAENKARNRQSEPIHPALISWEFVGSCELPSGKMAAKRPHEVFLAVNLKHDYPGLLPHAPMALHLVDADGSFSLKPLTTRVVHYTSAFDPEINVVFRAQRSQLRDRRLIFTAGEDHEITLVKTRFLAR